MTFLLLRIQPSNFPSRLRKMHLPANVKFFTWKLLWLLIPTRAYLVSKHILPPTSGCYLLLLCKPLSICLLLAPLLLHYGCWQPDLPTTICFSLLCRLYWMLSLLPWQRSRLRTLCGFYALLGINEFFSTGIFRLTSYFGSYIAFCRLIMLLTPFHYSNIDL